MNNNIFECFIKLCKLNNASFKNAFTLAEVLITLGIIGVVAAMTIPTVVTKQESAKFQSGLKKAYSVITQAHSRMAMDYGVDIWRNTSDDMFGYIQFKQYFIKYFKGAIDCSVGIDSIKYKQECTFSKNEGGVVSSTVYQTYARDKFADQTLFDDGKFLLPDGMLIMIKNRASTATFVTVDLNNVSGGPNVWG